MLFLKVTYKKSPNGLFYFNKRTLFNLDSAVELVERLVANGVIGVGEKFVVTLLVMRTFSQ